MLRVLKTTWPLLLGILMLMVGNGMQGTMLGIRGAIEGFSTQQLSIVMSAYFAGFLGGSYLTPRLLRQVGHVRVFAAMGSMISAILILYPALPDWMAWAGMRVLIGFCFSAVYVTAESWLNSAATNDTRGQALSAYMIVQMLGIIASQALLNVTAPDGYDIFVIPSVLVSLSFLPILLAATPSPTFDSTRALPFRRLLAISPLGCAGMLLTGGIFAAMFGMSSVWGARVGLSVPQISTFVAVMYVGGLVLQYPVGRASDRMDRRQLILGLSVAGAVVVGMAALVDLPFPALLAVAAVLGGVVNPLYALLIAYTNDFLDRDEMAAASAGLLFLNGFGAIFGPLATGWLMERSGPSGFFAVIATLFALLATYAAWRMTRRAAPARSGSTGTLAPTASPLAVGALATELGEDLPPRRATP